MKKGLLTGLLLFGFFFGAGNLIFPPTLGLFSGENFWLAISGFVLSGVGIAIFTLLVGAVSNGSFRVEIEQKTSPLFSILFLVGLYLAVGPFFAIPRTATVPYSISIQPLEVVVEQLGVSSSLLLFVYTGIYFALAYWIASRRSTILNSIGKILTPLFAGLILLLVILGSIKYAAVPPMVAAEAYQVNRAFGTGFIEGYNTIDALGAVAFSVIAVNTLKQFQFHSRAEYLKTIVGVGFVTVIGFSVLYIGLANLGNHFPISEDILMDETINKGSYILVESSKALFGSFGQLFMALLVGLTCFTTTVGLIVSTGEFFEETFPKITYKTYTILFTMIGFAISNLGLNTVIQFSLPVLMILYPITIVLVVLIMLNKFFSLSKIGMRLTVGVTVLTVILTALSSFFNWPSLQSWMNIIPLSSLSLGWLIPAMLGLFLSFVLPNRQKGERFDFEKMIAE